MTHLMSTTASGGIRAFVNGASLNHATVNTT